MDILVHHTDSAEVTMCLIINFPFSPKKHKVNLRRSKEIHPGIYSKVFYMLKVEHIGIAVKQLATSVPLFEKLLNSQCYKTEQVETEKVNTAFFQKGETKIELLESTDSEGVITKFIEKKGEGIHHIAFEVENIEM